MGSEDGRHVNLKIAVQLVTLILYNEQNTGFEQGFYQYRYVVGVAVPSRSMGKWQTFLFSLCFVSWTFWKLDNWTTGQLRRRTNSKVKKEKDT